MSNTQPQTLPGNAQPDTRSAGVSGEVQQRDPEFLDLHDREAVAAALGLQEEDISNAMPVQTVSTGMAFCIVPLRSLAVAARLSITREHSEQCLAAHGSKFFYCITPAAADSGADWHARMQFYGTEDPATGSAAGCAIAYLVRHGAVASGQRIVIDRGLRSSGRAGFMRMQKCLTAKCVKSVLVAAPCTLQADDFSCRNALDFNRALRRKLNLGGSQRTRIRDDVIDVPRVCIFRGLIAIASLFNTISQAGPM